MDATDKIITAFLKLLRQKSYSQISVNEITQQVGITRTYFYQLFDNKEDLARVSLYSIVRQILGAFATSFTNAKGGRMGHHSIVKRITLTRQYQHELESLLAIHHGSFDLSQEFQQQLQTMVLKGLGTRYSNQIKLDYAVHVFIAATMETIHWIIDHPKVSTEQIIPMVDDFSGRGMLTMLQH